MNFSRTYRASIDRVEGISFSVPSFEVQEKAMKQVVELEAKISELESGLASLDSKKAEILANRTIKILNKNNTKKIVLSKTMKKQEKYINFLISKKIEIVDSKWLFEVVSYDVIEYILNKRKQKKELSETSVLINENTLITLGCFSECWDDYNKLETLKLIKYFLEKGNQVQ